MTTTGIEQMDTRQANIDDFGKLYTFWEEAGLHLYPKDEERVRFATMLRLNPDLCLLLLDDNKQIVGSVLGGFDGRTASINRLAIHPKLQKQGWGKYLIHELEKIFLARGIRKIAIQIHKLNTEVIPFYKKLGFVEMDYVEMFYKDF